MVSERDSFRGPRDTVCARKRAKASLAVLWQVRSVVAWEWCGGAAHETDADLRLRVRFA